MGTLLWNNRRTRWFVLAAGALVTGFSVFLPQVQALIGRQEGGASSHAGLAVRQPVALTNGLTAWWKLDGTLLDSSGNGHNGTGVGSYTSATGKFGGAYSFNAGTYGSVSIGSMGARPTAGTISFWMKPASTASFYNPFTTAGITPSGGNANNAGIRFEMDSTGKFVAAVGNDSPTGTDAAHGLTPHTYLASGLQTGQWYHVVLTWDSSSNTVSGYLNNSLAFSEANTTWATNFNSVFLGAGYSTARYLHGTLDDVRMYNRALSAADISQLYLGSKPAACDQTCVGYWKLDGDAKSSVSSAGDGTLTNFTFDGTTNGWTAGNFGGGLLFDGTNTSVSLPTSTLTGLTQHFTFSAWINASSAANGGSIVYAGPASNCGCSGSSMFRIAAVTGGTLSYTIGNAGNIAAAQNMSGTHAIFDGTWHHIAMAYDGTTLSGYVDGVLDATTVPANANYGSGAPSVFTLDAYGNGYATIYQGMFLDDARVYSRALTSYEVYEQYQAGR